MYIIYGQCMWVYTSTCVHLINRFSKCDDCVLLKKHEGKTFGATRKFWQNEHGKHIDWQRRERAAQDADTAEAMAPGSQVMVIKMDNMDNSKSALPLFKRDPKSVEKCIKLVTHITGVHIPGARVNPIKCFTWHDRFPAGSDTVMTILLKVLRDYEDPLPPVLKLHMDNCFRENKNRFVLGLCHLLVHYGVFKKVSLSFLPVGHTHNIVDQMFSRFSVALAKAMCMTVEELHEVCSENYNVKGFKPVFEHIDEMANWTALLEPLLPAHKFQGISKPRLFEVFRDEEGKVRHRYRNQLQDATSLAELEKNFNNGYRLPKLPGGVEGQTDFADLGWMPNNRSGYELFQADALPRTTDIPAVALKPVAKEVLQELIKALKPHVETDAQLCWWTSKIAKFEDEDRRYDIFLLYD